MPHTFQTKPTESSTKSDPPPTAGRRPGNSHEDRKRAQPKPPRPRKVPLTRITVDYSVQPRFRMNRDAIAQYCDVYRIAPEQMPPVTLLKARDGSLQLVDGFHRYEAAQRARCRDIRAVILEEEMTRAEVLWLAVDANRRNGLLIGRAERRIVFRRFVEAGQNRKPDGSLMSSREIVRALQFGSHQSVLNWMKLDFPKVHAEMIGADSEDAEEPEPYDTVNDALIGYIGTAEWEYLRQIAKAAAEVPKQEIARAVSGIEQRISHTLGVASLAELLPDEEEWDDF